MMMQYFMKRFHVHDGMGLKMCQAAGIKVAILTSENTPIVAKRGEKLKLDYVFQGMKCKLEVITKLCEELGIGLENVAFIVALILHIFRVTVRVV